MKSKLLKMLAEWNDKEQFDKQVYFGWLLVAVNSVLAIIGLTMRHL